MMNGAIWARLSCYFNITLPCRSMLNVVTFIGTLLYVQAGCNQAKQFKIFP